MRVEAISFVFYQYFHALLDSAMDPISLVDEILIWGFQQPQTTKGGEVDWMQGRGWFGLRTCACTFWRDFCREPPYWFHRHFPYTRLGFGDAKSAPASSQGLDLYAPTRGRPKIHIEFIRTPPVRVGGAVSKVNGCGACGRQKCKLHLPRVTSPLATSSSCVSTLQ